MIGAGSRAVDVGGEGWRAVVAGGEDCRALGVTGGGEMCRVYEATGAIPRGGDRGRNAGRPCLTDDGLDSTLEVVASGDKIPDLADTTVSTPVDADLPNKAADCARSTYGRLGVQEKLRFIGITTDAEDGF